MESTMGTAVLGEGMASRVSPARLWTGRVTEGLIAAFLLMDIVIKFMKPPQVAEAFVRSGWSLDLSVPLGVILLISLVVYLVPRTSMLGAILLTGYLGGAVASNMRLHEPLFSYTLFPIYFGVLTWLSLWLRDPRLNAFIPLRRAT